MPTTRSWHFLFLIILPAVGCNNASVAPPAAGPDTLGQSNSAALRKALVGRYAESTGRGTAVSYQYPRFENHPRPGFEGDSGTFEIFDRHPLLDQTGLSGSGAVVLATQSDSGSGSGMAVIRPIYAGSGKLQGFQFLTIFEVELPSESQHRLLYTGPPEFGTIRSSKPHSGINSVPEFMPRVPRE